MKAQEPDKFKNKRGDLTPYALLCGYIQQADIAGYSLTLWSDCNFVHVRLHDHDDTGKRVFWESYEGSKRLTQARAHYNKTVRQLNAIQDGRIASLAYSQPNPMPDFIPILTLVLSLATVMTVAVAKILKL